LADCLDTCTSSAQRRGDGVYDYIRSGETSKVKCSIISAWVRVGAAFDESDHSEVWEGPGSSL